MIIDMHYHLDERLEPLERLIAEMDRHGIDKTVLITPMVDSIHLGGMAEKLSTLMRKMLTGRGVEFLLLPFSLSELEQIYKPYETDTLLPFFMRYGLYPEIVDKSEADAEYLIFNLSSKHLYKDILEFEN